MKVDEHEDYFLEEYERQGASGSDVNSGRSIDFVGEDGGGNASSSAVGASAKPDNSRRRRRFRRILASVVLACAVILAVVFWVRYLNPYAVEAQETGYVVSLEKRGLFFKTFEGVIATRTALSDSANVYARDFTFTVANDSLAHVLQGMAAERRAVTVVYEKYYGTLPWRGSSKNVVVGMR